MPTQNPEEDPETAADGTTIAKYPQDEEQVTTTNPSVLKYLQDEDQVTTIDPSHENETQPVQPVRDNVDPSPGAYAVVGPTRFNAAANQVSIPEQDTARTTNALPANEDEGVVVARPIDEDGTQSAVLPHAEEYDVEQQQQASTSKNWTATRRIIMCVGVGVALMVMATVLWTTLRTPLASDEPISSNTKNDMVIDSLIESRVMALVANISSQASFAEDTPQAKALEWLMGDPSLSTYQDWRIQQRYILSIFYYATEGPEWLYNNNWLDYTKHECQWYTRTHHLPPELEAVFPICYNCISETAHAITNAPCGNPDGDLREPTDTFKYLLLGANRLKGTIPDEIFMLTSLRGINLGLNSKLQGSIPSTVGLLTDLQVLGLVVNKGVGGTVPTQIGRLSHLSDLLLLQTSVSGAMPSEVGLLNSLEILFWELQPFGESKGLSGSIPTQVGLLSSMKHISLIGHRNLGGTLPTEMQGLQQLTILEIIQTGLAGPIPSELGLMTSIEAMSLRMNQLSENIPSELGLLTSSSVLRLVENRLSGSVPEELCHMGAWDPPPYIGISFDCSDTLCGCSWCPCNDTNKSG